MRRPSAPMPWLIGEAMGESSLLGAYRLATRLAHPLAGPLLAWRLRRGKEDGARLGERYGTPGLERPAGPLVWVHAASVGETVSVLPLLERIVAMSAVSGLITTGTVTSARVAGSRLGEGLMHQFAPLDGPRFVGAFLDHWRPAAAIFAESELWPNMILETARRGVPLALVNARMSERSFARWRQRGSAMAKALLGRFDVCLAQSQADADRLAVLGAAGVQATGNLKFDVPPPPADEAELAALAAAIGDRPCWLAASLHPGEDAQVIAAHGKLAARFPRLVTLMAPRHPERGAEVAGRIAEAGLAPARRSVDMRPRAETDIFVMDSIGELGLAFRLAPVVLMGGSLVPHGGQNPIEAAKLEVAILHGPHVSNFAEIYAALDGESGAVRISGADAMAGIVSDLLASPDARQAQCRAAARVLARFAGPLDRTLTALEPILGRLPRRR